MGDRLATTDMGRKEGAAVPLLGSLVPISHNVAGTEDNLRAKFHLDPSKRLATIHHYYRQTDRQTDRQTGQDRQESQPGQTGQWSHRANRFTNGRRKTGLS